ncbi:MAG: DUF554 domain-containing protein [Theionarchaea archaeon]|nr:DUF554 domain-containing protein [Theionarchaea archaeon]
MQGTLFNVTGVIIGSAIGLTIHSRLPQRIITTTFQGIGLFTIVLGVTMAVKTTNFLLIIVSIVTGSIVGELLNIEAVLDKLSEKIRKKTQFANDKFSEGFITSSLMFCIGSMAILGALEEGLGGTPHLLMAKSVLDGFCSLVLAASLGVGVIFSAVPLLIYQGGLTLFASSLQGSLTECIINELTSVGGLLLIGLGIDILEIKKLKIMNMLPSLAVVVVLAWLFL